MRSRPRSEKTLLATYRDKRRFEDTPEPAQAKRLKARKSQGEALRFVIQKHAASHLHYDFRLEAEGVLKSWAIPKGPSLDPADKRLAMQVEDHPLDYFDFEGVIPAGNYGAGEVIVWDFGTYETEDGGDPAAAIAGGKIKLRLHGQKMRGGFTLVRMHGKAPDGRAWLLLHEHDAHAEQGFVAEDHPKSVKTGRTLAQIKAELTPETWHSNRPSKDAPPKGARARKTASNVASKATSKPPSKPASRPASKLASNAGSKPVSKGARKGGARGGTPRAEAPGRAPKPLHPMQIKTPMLATLVDAPFDDDDWVFEVKWDGFRALCTLQEDGSVELVSRTGKDLLPEFPNLAGLAKSFRETPLVLDGEIVALDAEGKSSFQRLQGRLGARPPRTTYVAFDLLFAGGEDLRARPLLERKAKLEALVREGSPDVLYSKHVPREGRALFAEAAALDLEGIIGKRKDAPYRETRTRDWVKIKVQKIQECVVAGYTDPGGARADFGSLVLGTYEEAKDGGKKQLVYRGNVGTGFTRASLSALLHQMKPLETSQCPFAVRPKTKARAHWVKPVLVAQVRFTEWTSEGSMRHPAFLGLRDDKDAKDVSREREVKASRVEHPR